MYHLVWKWSVRTDAQLTALVQTKSACPCSNACQINLSYVHFYANDLYLLQGVMYLTELTFSEQLVRLGRGCLSVYKTSSKNSTCKVLKILANAGGNNLFAYLLPCTHRHQAASLTEKKWFWESYSWKMVTLKSSSHFPVHELNLKHRCMQSRFLKEGRLSFINLSSYERVQENFDFFPFWRLCNCSLIQLTNL